MMPELKLSVKIEQIGGKVIFRLSGAINETFAPFVDQLTKQLPKMNFLQFNLGGITLINSSGTREWTKLMSKSQHINISLFECPKVFIDQVNTVEGFLTPNCSVRSFFIPYYSEEISKEKSVLFECEKVLKADGSIEIPEELKMDNQTYMLDVIPSKYFIFLKKFTD